HDARRHGLQVLPPCMRDGDWECTTEPTENPDRPALRIGWRHIRGLGEKSLEALKTARGWDRFSSIDDVIQRSKLQRTDALQLARAGAFSCWNPIVAARRGWRCDLSATRCRWRRRVRHHTIR